jgi:PKD repeat protein
MLGTAVWLTGLLVLMAAVSSQAGPGDGTVLGAVKVHDNGADEYRMNIVVIGEGFTIDEQVNFDARVDQLASDLFGYSPFDSFAAAINLYKINVASDESGADDPIECGGSGAEVATYFDATYCADGVIRRALVVNDGTVYDVLNTYVPLWDEAIVLVNSTIHGGTGGGISVVALSSSWRSTVVHELGHSAFGLADEYEYWAGCGIDTDRDHHPAYEPSEPNVTTENVREFVKWNHLIDPGTPVPTQENPNCEYCDPYGSGYPPETVGLWEGAHYYHCDAYRPVYECMMRVLGAPFCGVCQEVAEQTLSYYMPPTFAAWPRGAEGQLTVDFNYTSPLPVSSWTWYFGDGDSAIVENPSHSYGPGAYDVTMVVTAGTGQQTVFEEGYVTVWADTLTAPEKQDTVSGSGYWEISMVNAVPIHEMILPLEITNVTSVLFFDSISYVGTRMEHFESKQVVFDNRFAGSMAMRLRCDVGGGAPPMAPGEGPIARVYYRVHFLADPGDTAYIATAQLGSWEFEATTYDTTFQPVSYGATLHVVESFCSCPDQADFDFDGFVTALDLGEMIDILYAGAEDVQHPECPMPRADFDCDTFSTSLDLTGIIDYLFASGAGPCDPCGL